MSAVVVLVTCLAGSVGAVTRFVVDGEIFALSRSMPGQLF